jgi:glutaredoxin-like YruB-family protein
MSVTVYSTPDCEYCKATKEYLKANGVEYSEKDVYKDREAAREMVAKSGGRAVPVVDINGHIVVGFDQDKIDRLLGI